MEEWKYLENQTDKQSKMYTGLTFKGDINVKPTIFLKYQPIKKTTFPMKAMWIRECFANVCKFLQV